jgi:TolB-like protein/Flp pilus assembly protein TadD
MKRDNKKDGLQTKLESILLDLETYRVLLHFQNHKEPLILHFDKPARRFYLSLIALVVAEMKKRDKPDFIHIRKYEKTLKMLDNSLAGKNASETLEGMWDKIRKAWRYSLPDLEAGTHFKIMERHLIRPYEKGGKYRYECPEDECHIWANLFDYDENNPWRFKFAIDLVSLKLNDVSLLLGGLRDNSAWQEFVKRLSVQPKAMSREKKAVPGLWKKVALSVTAVLIVGALSWAIWNAHRRPSPITADLKLSHELSIAVLPFVNMSGDPNQEYFSDGMTEEIITALSKVPKLFVIARSSTFTYKGKPLKVQQVAEDLGVRYVLEGSVRKVGDQVRISAQLVDATTGHHLWAERFDATLGDIFALQDTCTRKIVAALALKLTGDEEKKLTFRYTDNLEAYDNYLKGLEHLHVGTPDGYKMAVGYFEKAVELDPDYSSAHAGLANAYHKSIERDLTKELGWPDARARVQRHLQMAMKNPTPYAHYTVAKSRLYQRRYDEAIAEAEHAIVLDPNYPDGSFMMGWILTFAGRSAEAVDYYKKAMRLDPQYPGGCLYYLGLAQYCLKEYQEAATTLERSQKLKPQYGPWPLAITYAQLGRGQEAADLLAKYFEKRGWKAVPIENTFEFWPFKEQKDLDHWAEGLRKSGLMRPWNPVYRLEYDKAIDDAKHAINLNPNDATAQHAMGESLVFAGRSAEALGYLEKAMRLDSEYPANWFTLGLAQFCLERYEEAATSLERCFSEGKMFSTPPMWLLAATYAHLGKQQKAEDVLTQYLKERGYEGYTVQRVLKYYLHAFKDPKDTERFAQGLHKAGLPME